MSHRARPVLPHLNAPQQDNNFSNGKSRSISAFIKRDKMIMIGLLTPLATRPSSETESSSVTRLQCSGIISAH
ncbi:hypothetical protein AAY473_013980, partial [Plecturocebus cupreus]